VSGSESVMSNRYKLSLLKIEKNRSRKNDFFSYTNIYCVDKMIIILRKAKIDYNRDNRPECRRVEEMMAHANPEERCPINFLGEQAQDLPIMS